ncbi:MAG TPA: hypothetical protein ENJ08_06685 [Gammaproteobacteria bacterium]|nr:hypothetical protein [Gammaproteobacteria bacterium]
MKHNSATVTFNAGSSSLKFALYFNSDSHPDCIIQGGIIDDDYIGKQTDARVIVAHPGHGTSLCVMRAGQSVAITMGFTPVGGIPMATRSGDIDPGLSDWMIRNAGLSPDEMDDILNHQSGLLALSGISENSAVVRQQICTQTSWLGLTLNESANASNNIRITTQNSKVSAWCIPHQ